MSQLSPVLRGLAGGRLAFWCAGCGEAHNVIVEGDQRPRWGYNGNPAKPTFTPSILVSWNEPSDNPDEFDDETKDRKHICHSYVTDGRIQYLTDSTHALAGRTIDLPEWPT